MIKVADELRLVIINTQEILEKTGIWNDRIENALSDIDGFLDRRVKYESMGWKRLFKYKEMESLNEDFRNNFFHLETEIITAIMSENIKRNIKAELLIQYPFRIGSNFKCIYSTLKMNDKDRLNNIDYFEIPSNTKRLLPRSGQVIKFP